MIEVEGLSKRFGALPVLKDLEFQVPRGSICGFIGPNGAGKTTTMRILATLEHPNGGRARVGGVDVVQEALRVRRMVGYMPDYYGTYADLTSGEYLEFFARAHKLTGALRASRVQDIIEFTEVGGLLSRPVEGLSKGQKQRLSLARALLPDPELLILDEPSAGLDPRARIELRELLKVLAERGKTVFISSHILSELSDLIDWVVIIDVGRIRHCGRPDAAVESTENTVYVIELASDAALARKFLLEQPAIRETEIAEDALVLRIDEKVERIEDLIARMVQAGVRFRQIQRRAADLEDVFLRVTGRRSSAPPR
jgi:ABC-2 type transport system ATP-binding protein